MFQIRLVNQNVARAAGQKTEMPAPASRVEIRPEGPLCNSPDRKVGVQVTKKSEPYSSEGGLRPPDLKSSFPASQRLAAHRCGEAIHLKLRPLELSLA